MFRGNNDWAPKPDAKPLLEVFWTKASNRTRWGANKKCSANSCGGKDPGWESAYVSWSCENEWGAGGESSVAEQTKLPGSRLHGSPWHKCKIVCGTAIMNEAKRSKYDRTVWRRFSEERVMKPMYGYSKWKYVL